MRRTPIALGCAVALCCAAPVPAHAARVLVMDAHGHVHSRVDPFVRGATPAPPAPPAATRSVLAPAHGFAARAHAKRSVRGELSGLLRAGAITQDAYDGYRASWDAAQRTLRRLHGRRFTELRAVLANVDDMAASGRLVAGRLPVLFRTVDANRRWWATGPLLAYGRRVELSGSELVWQSYPGQGIQLQWLGSFGKANGLFTGGRKYDDRLGALLDDAQGLATPRAGGIAWEYVFRFDGGRPPWVSSLAQGTALQAYSRAAIRLGRPELFQTARDGLGIFRVKAPEGVRVRTKAGAHYLQYSYAPRLRILNGFVQAVNGLHDFAALANDDEGRTLFAQGEAELRHELPEFDTGAWSLYSRVGGDGIESDLGYHELLRDFLKGLCTRLRDDAQADRPGGPPPDPRIYCDTADRFTAYLKQPPVLELRTTHPRARHRSTVRFTLSKVSTVTVTLRQRGTVVYSRVFRFGHGTHTIAFTPRHAGAVSIALRAVGPAGNAGTASGSLRVRAP